MHQIQRIHQALLQVRTEIRNHKRILHWMVKCWEATSRTSSKFMTQSEYHTVYSKLLFDMTICWDDEISDDVIGKMWHHDAKSFQHLNYDRFCCSVFFFVEMWVNEITLTEYERIFRHVYLILSGAEPLNMSSNPTSLASFESAIDNLNMLDSNNMNIGKSIMFDAERYYMHFGLPEINLDKLCPPKPRAASVAPRPLTAHVSEIPRLGYRSPLVVSGTLTANLRIPTSASRERKLSSIEVKSTTRSPLRRSTII